MIRQKSFLKKGFWKFGRRLHPGLALNLWYRLILLFTLIMYYCTYCGVFNNNNSTVNQYRGGGGGSVNLTCNAYYAESAKLSHSVALYFFNPL